MLSQSQRTTILELHAKGMSKRAIAKLLNLSRQSVRKVLEAAGSDLAHVVQTRNYVRDAGDVALYNQLYREYFPQPSPARTTITNCLPPSLKYEVEAIAVRKPAQ